MDSNIVIARSEATKQSDKRKISAKKLCFREKWIASHACHAELAVLTALVYEVAWIQHLFFYGF